MVLAVGTCGTGVPCEQYCIIKEGMACGSPQVTESSGWWGFLVSGILVEKGEAGLLRMLWLWFSARAALTKER